MGPSSVVTLTGPEHMRQRKLLLPPFHGERMREYEDAIVAATRRDMAGWPLGTPMRLQRAHAGDHAGGDPAGGVRRGGGADGGAEGRRSRELLEPMQRCTMLRFALSRPTVERPTGAIGDGARPPRRG